MTYQEYFISKWPNEACGYIKDGEFIPVENISDTPESNCEVSGEILLRNPEMFVHSHPINVQQEYDTAKVPSLEDLEGQLLMDIPWAIVVTLPNKTYEPIIWGDPEHRPSLDRRDFIFGVQDCLCLVRDYYYKEYEIILPLLAYTPDWDHEGKNFMDELYAQWGFVEVQEPNEGDVLMYKMPLSPVTNHVGIYTNRGVFWHTNSRFPEYVEYAKYARRLVRIVRHKDRL